ncbi:MAG: signal peptidase [Chloroflexota bacterium]|jgi:signal peptidase I|nr:signal peptidase [Chloroflexota bacterium]
MVSARSPAAFHLQGRLRILRWRLGRGSRRAAGRPVRIGLNHFNGKVVVIGLALLGLLCVVVVGGALAFLETFKIQGTAMEPTLHNNQTLLINRAAFRSGGPARGDVVVFHYPVQPANIFIKRIIGVPGDTIDVRAGQVYVNDLLQNEPYVRDHPVYEGQWVVPPASYFVLGDNRPNSSDSHVWGFVPAANLIGKELFAL